MITRSRALAIIIAAVGAVSGCARPSTLGSNDGSSSSQHGASRPNLIDQRVVPRLAALHITTPRAEGHELCRRLAIDILGRGPSSDELRQCLAARTVDAIVDTWMARPEHELNERRAWGELVEYDVTTTWYAYIVEADALAGSLAQGKIGYDDFAARFVVHPAFYSRHPDDDWSRMMFSLFLGRTARPDEVRAMRPLVGIWKEQSFFDPKLVKPNSVSRANVRKMNFDFCECDRLAVGGCTSRALGPTIELSGACETPTPTPTPAPPKPETLKQTSSMTPKGDPLAGASEPADEINGKNPPPLTPAQEARLLTIGAALASRPDFWEAAVDREMRRYLGWWQTGFKRPETDLPDVRAALAADLAKTKSVRALRRTILTSVLYTMPAGERTDVPATATATASLASARWTNGPRKLLAGEAWMDTMGLALGEHLGSCDHRFSVPIMGDFDPSLEQYRREGYEEIYVDPALVHHDRSTMIDPRKLTAFDYAMATRRLGGCGAARAQASSLGLAQVERDLAALLCAGASTFNPAAPTTTTTTTTTATAKPVPKSEPPRLEVEAGRLVERMLARPASKDEARRLASDMQACMTPSSKTKDARPACRDREAAMRWLCTRIATSAEFGTY